MAYFLKVTKQQSRTYLSIYESFYSPETKGTKHRSYRSLGNIQKLIDSGIDDPIAYFQKEVDRLNAQRKADNANKKINDRLINIVNIIFTKNVNLKITRNVNLLLPVLLTYVYLFRPFLVFQHIHKILGSI